MESDLWQERLRRTAPRTALEFDEFYCPERTRPVPGSRHDVGAVAMKEVRGLELTTVLWEQSAALSLLWLSDDEKLGLVAFDSGTIMPFPPNCTDQELADGLRQRGAKEQWEAVG